jgi:hypothetical protein
MDIRLLKWIDRSDIFSHSPKPNYPFCMGYKFKKIKDIYSIKGKQPELKEIDFNTRDLKLESISMLNGVCKFCSSKEDDDKRVEHNETYAYISYRKNMPNLFNLL